MGRKKDSFELAQTLVNQANIEWKVKATKDGTIIIKPRIFLEFEKAFGLLLRESLEESVPDTLEKMIKLDLVDIERRGVLVFNPRYFF